MYLQQQTGFYSRKGSSQFLVEHPIVSERVPFRLRARYGVEVGAFLPATIALTHPTNKYYTQRCDLSPHFF